MYNGPVKFHLKTMQRIKRYMIEHNISLDDIVITDKSRTMNHLPIGTHQIFKNNGILSRCGSTKIYSEVHIKCGKAHTTIQAHDVSLWTKGAHYNDFVSWYRGK